MPKLSEGACSILGKRPPAGARANHSALIRAFEAWFRRRATLRAYSVQKKFHRKADRHRRSWRDHVARARSHSPVRARDRNAKTRQSKSAHSMGIYRAARNAWRCQCNRARFARGKARLPRRSRRDLARTPRHRSHFVNEIRIFLIVAVL